MSAAQVSFWLGGASVCGATVAAQVSAAQTAAAQVSAAQVSFWLGGASVGGASVAAQMLAAQVSFWLGGASVCGATVAAQMYDISELFKFIDRLADLSCMVLDKSVYVPKGKDFIKEQIFILLRGQAASNATKK
ncbi:hypothetical protein niasHT_018860 [Heterodera trifolii]|uniref:Uncharacterized protein n=1 Tax=Heterodera trifolii TaxID=157864 RepID=A0ABD2KXG8_9BILA